MSTAYEQAVNNMIRFYIIQYESPHKIQSCLECKDEVLLIWDSKVRPYFVHTHNFNCNSGSAILGELREYAKRRISEFFSIFGNVMMFTNKCKQCCKILTDKCDDISCVMPNYVHIFKNRRYFLDVACLDVTGTLAFGIMFRNSEKCAPAFMEGLNIPWVSISVNEVVNTLSVCVDNICFLHNYRYFSMCDDRTCLSLREIAYSLGYLITHRAYSCTARKLIDISTTGSYSSNIDMWYSTGWATLADIASSDISRLWASFLRRHVCLRCGTKASVEYSKPYCLTCFVKSGSDKIPLLRTNVEAKVKEELAASFQWLNDVPNFADEVEGCFFCDRTYTTPQENIYHHRYWEPDTNRVEATTRWQGEKKRCCTLCLEDKILEYNIVWDPPPSPLSITITDSASKDANKENLFSS